MAENLQDILKDPEQLKKICKDAFEEADTDKSGFVEESELAAMYNKKFPGTFSDDEVRQNLKKYDVNNDGKLSFDEFSTFVTDFMKGIAGVQ